MRTLVFLIALLTGLQCSAQKGFRLPEPKQSLLVATLKLDSALVSKDTAALNRLLHERVSYGHSNGWIQSRTEVIDDLYNGKLSYLNITPTNTATTFEGNAAIVREDLNVRVLLDGKEMSFSLKVLQSWVWNKRWMLLGRQSVKA